MAEAGVEIAFDLTAHSVIGLSEVLKKYLDFRRFFKILKHLALEREPDVIICVDFSGFNRRFAQAIKSYARTRQDWFHDWNPKLVQFVSPQVWASREGRAYKMAEAYDLVLSIFPFEREWYAKRVPRLRVEFVGHPMVDRFAGKMGKTTFGSRPLVLLLPGSRPGEIHRHLPVMLGALNKLKSAVPDLESRMVLPNAQLQTQARNQALPEYLKVQVGGLAEALAQADIAMASTGTVTMECAWFGVPTVTMYKTSWSTYQIGKQLVKVKSLTMPNLLAQAEVFPEFVQDRATDENVAKAALELLSDADRRARIKASLKKIVSELGAPGACKRAAQLIVQLMGT